TTSKRPSLSSASRMRMRWSSLRAAMRVRAKTCSGAAAWSCGVTRTYRPLLDLSRHGSDLRTPPGYSAGYQSGAPKPGRVVGASEMSGSLASLSAARRRALALTVVTIVVETICGGADLLHRAGWRL